MAQQPNEPQNYHNQSYYQPGQAPAAGGSGLTPEQRRVRQRRRQEQLDRKLSRRRTLLSILLLVIVVASFMTIRAVNGNMGQLSEVELDDMDLDMDDEAEEALYEGPPVATISFVGDISVSADQVAAATAHVRCEELSGGRGLRRGKFRDQYGRRPCIWRRALL